MYSFNIILTEICNANCSHCYMSSDNFSNKRTMKENEIDLIMEKMPSNTKTVVFTGGEIFLVRKILKYAIKKLKNKNPNVEIGLESNGIYLYNNIDNAKRELIELKNIGVNFIRFSDDLFHKQGGIDLHKVRTLKLLENDNTPTIKYLVQTTAVGIGKAESLPSSLKSKKNCMNNNNSVENPYMFLDVSGNVYICTWKCIPPIANMIHDSWENIVEKMQSEFYQLILAGKIEEAISSLDKTKSEDNYKISKKEGQCMLCYKTFLKELI